MLLIFIEFFYEVFRFIKYFFCLIEWISTTMIFLFAFFALIIFSCYFLLKESRNKVVVKLSRKAHTGYGNIIFTLLSIAWASSVSVFGSDLKNQWFGSDSLGWESIFFFVSVGCALLVGVLHYVGQKAIEKEKESRAPREVVRVAATRVSDLSGMLHSCQVAMYDFVRDFPDVPLEELTDCEANIILAKENCLTAMLDILKCWDDSNDDSIYYKANLFNLIKSSSALEVFNIQENFQHDTSYSFNVEAVEKSPFFLFNDNWRAKLERCDYILVNEQSLSKTLSSASEGIHESCKEHFPICMPYSEEQTRGVVFQPNLEGAPQAIKLKRVMYLPQVKQNIERFMSSIELSPVYKSFFNQDFRQSVVSYYETDVASSIISIPLFKYKIWKTFAEEFKVKPELEKDSPTCVLNVYANKDFILSNQKMAEAFYDLTKPICDILSVLISLRIALVEYRKEVDSFISFTTCNAHVKAYRTFIQQQQSEVLSG